MFPITSSTVVSGNNIYLAWDNILLTNKKLHGFNHFIFFRCSVTILFMLRTGSSVTIHSDVVYLDEGESRQQDCRTDEKVQEQRRSTCGCHSFTQHHCPHHRFCRSRCRIYETLWRRILRYHFRYSHPAYSGTFWNHPENHRCLLLAFSGHAIYQDYQGTHHHHLPAGSALRTYHQGIYT